MPHIILEFSSNLKPKPTVATLAALHQALPEMGPFDLHSTKSRLIEHASFCVGACAADEAFVHLELAILSGRDAETKKAVSEKLIDYLKRVFADAFEKQPLSLTVEIREMERSCYSKATTVVG